MLIIGKFVRPFLTDELGLPLSATDPRFCIMISIHNSSPTTNELRTNNIIFHIPHSRTRPYGHRCMSVMRDSILRLTNFITTSNCIVNTTRWSNVKHRRTVVNPCRAVAHTATMMYITVHDTHNDILGHGTSQHITTTMRDRQYALNWMNEGEKWNFVWLSACLKR